jgi:tetratricopeptide (TPR) repeat protein
MSASPQDDLRQELTSGQVVVIVGAGVSVAATGGAPTASWTGLLADGVAYCQALLGPSLPAGWADRRRAQLASGDTEELISAAEDITRRLGGPDGGEFARWLKGSIGTLRASSPQLPAALAELGVPLATTNYDGLLEAATGRPAVTWRQGALVHEVVCGDHDAILHLHGHWQDPASVVLGIRSYEAVLGDAHAEAMLKALASTRTLVFVGCGAGLSDPNFGALRGWLSEVFAGTIYRHYRLCRTEELSDLWDEHGLDERIVPVAYGDHHDDLVPFLRGLTPQKTTARPAPAAAPATARHLPPPPRCFGRDMIVEELVTTLLAESPPPTPVLGPGGIGKSTVCLAALHEPRVAQRYRDRRYFVRCNATKSGEAVLAEVAATLGLSIGPDLAARTLAYLGQAPSVLVLDNAETPWWADPEGTEGIFATLAGVRGLALVASLRGRQRPFGLAWRDAIDVPPLVASEARKVFLAVAGQAFTGDPHLDELVAAQDGLPLTTTLLAYLAEGEPDLAGLWRQWTQQRVALLRGGAGRQEVSAAVSFELSINSTRMTDQARRLLFLLGVLPDGIAHDDLERLLPGAGEQAARTLRKMGLAFDEAGHLRVLQPLRDHLQAVHAPEADELGRAVAHYCTLAETLGWRIGRSGGAEASNRLVAERGNLEAMLRHGLADEDPRSAIRAIRGFGEFLRLARVGTPEVLEAAIDTAGKLDEVSLQADCLWVLGDIASGRSDYDTARTRFEQARRLAEQAGNVVGQANCIYSLGDVALARFDYDTAQARYQRAQLLYEQAGNVVGQANCIYSLGAVALARFDYDTAQARYQQAQPLYQQAGDILGQANCIYSLGEVARGRSDYDTAQVRYQRAQPLYEQAGSIVGQINCVKGAADIALARSDLNTAEAHLKRAQSLYEQTGNVVGQAKCIHSLGDVALARSDYDTAQARYEEALPLYQQLEDITRQASCIYSLGDVARGRSDYDTAQARYEEALTLYQRISDPSSADAVQRQLSELLRRTSEDRRSSAR